MRNTIDTGSDFSGVGAFDQALERLGIKQNKLFACDMDKYARKTYCLNFGTENDIILSSFDSLGKKTTVKDSDYSFYYPKNVYDREIPEKSLDIYMTSPPCQSFSLAGKRKGEDSKNGVLFYNSHEFIQKNKPRFFIFENVKGLLSDDGGKTFQRWVDYLGGKSVNGNPVIFPHDEATPYHVYYRVLNAKHYGIPQNRERIFIIGIRDDADNTFSFPKPFHLEKRLKDVLESEVDEKYFLSDKMLNYFDSRASNFNNGNINFKDEESVASTITSSSKSLDISDNIIRLANVNPSGNGMNGNVYSDEGVSPTLLTNKGEGVKIGTWRTHEDGKGFRGTEDNNCPTIPARDREDGSGQPVIKILGYTRDAKGKVTSRHEQEHANTLHTGTGGGGNTDQFVIGAIRGRNPQNPLSRVSGLPPEQMLEINENGTSNALTTVQKDNVVVIPANNSKGYDIAEEEEDSINFSNPNSETRRGRVGKKVSQTLDTACNQGVFTQQRIRRLTPKECFKLMDFNDNFKWNVSDSQAYKQAGNSICVGVLVEIIKKLKLC